ncbi:hypothetical protein AB0L67_28450 [Streptomyces flaveolus]
MAEQIDPKDELLFRTGELRRRQDPREFMTREKKLHAEIFPRTVVVV